MSVSTTRAGDPKRKAWWPSAAEKQPDPASEADRNVARLLRLLGDSDMTIAALREQGVRSPAQGLYDLQVAGYRIQRLPTSAGSGHPSVRYRLETD